MENYEKKIGSFIQIPNVGRGQLKYVGAVEGKPGIFVGVDLLANIGKNDGTFRGKRYFDTEYTQSGLFIQLQKVASLIDLATGSASRRETFGDAHGGSRRSASLTDPRSPTPIRANSRQSSAVFSDTMDIDHEDRRVLSAPGRDLELKIQQQNQELSQYKKVLSEQRIVLEEIQPAIDDYEEKLQQMEAQVSSLEAQLSKERETQRKQKQYFETEHEQLLSVVEELHTEIRENEKRMLNAAQPSQPSDLSELTAENEALRNELEDLKAQQAASAVTAKKWEKEREQLKLQIDSLSSEYQYVNKELRDAHEKLKESQESQSDLSEIEQLKLQLEAANAKIQELEQGSPRPTTPALTTGSDPIERESESLPLYIPKKADRAAGRPKWCALCERDGHNSVDCPYENDQLF